MDPSKPIEYLYFNIHTNEFYHTLKEAYDALPSSKHTTGWWKGVVNSMKHNQTLYGVGVRHFTDIELALRARRKSGMI